MADPEHRVAMHRLVEERKAADLPAWAHKLNLGDVFHNQSLTFEQRRDAIVSRIKTSSWIKPKLKSLNELDFDDLDLVDLIDELGEAADAEEFDAAWSEFYDYADSARVWINTIAAPARVEPDPVSI